MKRLLVAVALIAAPSVTLVERIAHAEAEDDLRDGDKYFEEGDWKRAATSYDRAIAKAPSQVSAEAYGKRAAIFIIQKDTKGGLEFIAKAKTRYPNAPEIEEQEALMLWGNGSRDQAIEIAQNVVKARPQAFSNQLIIGEYFAARDPVKTAAAFEQYLAHRPPERESNDVLPRIQLGFAYLANARAVLGDGDEPRAQQLYSKAAEQFDYIQRKLGKKPNAQVNAENGLCAAYTGLRKWDQALTVCERIVQNPKAVDTSGSTWYNLATAYLANRQSKKARNAATEFARVRKGEARGSMLIGDTFYAESDWANALDQYSRAEKQLKPNQSRDQIQLSIRLGKTYRRIPSANGSNLALAVDKLSTAWNANPTSMELATELGSAYLEAKQDAKATALTDKVMTGADFAKAPNDQRAAVYVLAGKSLFNQHKLREARQRFESAQEIKKQDISIQRELISTINEQAFEAGAKDARAAQQLLDQALAIDPGSATTLTNVAVLAIERGDCDIAQRQLIKLREVRGSDAVLTGRLLARSYLCSTRPDPKRASEAYAAAEKEAKKANAQASLAEIYTEWAPLLWDNDLQSAIDKLEVAVQVSSQDPEVAPAAKRNLALALYRRGWKQLRENKATEAASDFERATRDPSVLKGTESMAFDFSYAVALLDAGRASDAARIFKNLSAKGNQGSYLKGAYAKIGSQFFSAYANYRSQTGQARAAACNELAKLEGDVGGKIRELVASCWENVAVDEWRAGNPGNAQKALATADKTATPDQKRRLTMDHAAMALGKDKLDELEALGGNPPESLIDLGIVYDMLGKPKEAYDAWNRAKARGATAPGLQRWIDAKKRIYGY
ncbi:MAG TPA: tetratricopeptide repeat protein [Kofleriaceae bacterium]|nr:tetratricopeptide repeat protein [Kofleriaceae bacterium]